jgi:hypothetical protein
MLTKIKYNLHIGCDDINKQAATDDKDIYQTFAKENIIECQKSHSAIRNSQCNNEGN